MREIKVQSRGTERKKQRKSRRGGGVKGMRRKTGVEEER